MEIKKPEIVMVSGSCCSPSLAGVEKDLEKRLRETIAELKIDAEVNVISLGAVLAGEAPVAQEQTALLQAMFQKYGVRMAPAGLVGKRVLFAGGAPAAEKLTALLESL